MTYNIRLDAASDGIDNWHNRKYDMVRYINHKKPDFLGIQEGLVHQTLYLDSLLQEYKFIGVGRDNGILDGEIMALYYKPPWRLLQDTTLWLSSTPQIPSKGEDAACFRTCTIGLFTNEKDTIMVLNTHFDHIGKKSRQSAVRIIFDFIDAYNCTCPIILMGDFNITPSDPIYNLITERMVDTYTQHNVQERATFNGFKTIVDPTDRIDYIFTNHKFYSSNSWIEQPKTAHNRQLSDHFPVLSNLSILHE